MVAWGVDPIKVGEYTPYELTLIAKQKRNVEQTEFENLICLAWHTEALARQKKLPRLEKLLKEARKKPNQKASSKSDAILKAMAAAKGVIIK
ncbi:MAG: hypothetical protein NC311_11895 [Muribaculaceae bacterium]|nr:hypothetical protein [Muribaculaceae bacterium]